MKFRWRKLLTLFIALLMATSMLTACFDDDFWDDGDDWDNEPTQENPEGISIYNVKQIMEVCKNEEGINNQ